MFPQARRSLARTTAAGAALVLCLALGVSPALAQNPSTAQWQGTRTSGDGVMFFNSGKGVTLQDAAAGPVTFPTPVTILPAATTATGALATNFFVNGSISGTPNGANNNVYSMILADQIDAHLLPGGGVTMFNLGEAINAGAVGGRNGLFVLLRQAAATSAGANQFYVAGAFKSSGNFSAGGAAGSLSGILMGINPIVSLQTGAGLYWNGIAAAEFDVQAQTGTGIAYKEGMKIVQGATDAVSGSSADFAYGLTNASNGTAPGWNFGFVFNAPEGWWAIKSTGTLIGTYPSTIGGGPAMAAAHGVDLSAVTFSSDAFKSAGFSVDGSGNVKTAAITAPLASTLTLYAAGANIVNIGNTLTGTDMTVAGPAASGASVNLFTAQSGSTGQSVNLGCGGPSSDANVTCIYNAKGTGLHRFISVGNGEDFRIFGVASSVDYITVAPGIAGSPGSATLGVGGSDTDIDLILKTQGAGQLHMGSAGQMAANGSVATVLGSLGPAGASTAVRKWLVVKDLAGTTYYIPAF